MDTQNNSVNTNSGNLVNENNRSQNPNYTPNLEMMRYKAAKYHYKIQDLLNREYVSQNRSVPQGYEQYLKPFDS